MDVTETENAPVPLLPFPPLLLLCCSVFVLSRQRAEGGARFWSMELSSSLRPALSHVIIDLSRNCGS